MCPVLPLCPVLLECLPESQCQDLSYFAQETCSLCGDCESHGIFFLLPSGERLGPLKVGSIALLVSGKGMSRGKSCVIA